MYKLKVIFVNTNTNSLESLLSSKYLTLDNKKEISRFLLEETKKEKAASFILKNKYIGEYHLNEYQKPISDKYEFNISHSKGVVVFIKDNTPIGIDIEKIREVETDLIDYISNKEEKEYITNKEKFYEIWTNKESLVKCIGTGIVDKIKEIPSLPLNSKKEYKNKKFYSKTIKYLDYIISISRKDNKPFDIKIMEEIL